MGMDEEEVSSGEDQSKTLGATGDELVLWLINEAIKNGESTLERQEKLIDALRAQATSMLGWFVTLTTAVTFAAITAHKIVVAACMAALGCWACTSCVYTLLVKKWSYKEYDPDQILYSDHKSERDYKYASARGHQEAIEKNRITIKETTQALNMAWMFFCIMPPLGVLFYFIFP